ncbi:hypothetical protein [Jatrophihabitans fulvus]
MTDPTGFTLADGLALSGQDADEVWWRYAANGGTASFPVFVDRIEGAACDRVEHDLIAQTLNECFLDAGLPGFPVRYSGRPAPLPPAASANARAARGAQRRLAVEARLRSAAAARQAALLHATAARLMQTSGQLTYAHRAQQRAAVARRRATSLLQR